MEISHTTVVSSVAEIDAKAWDKALGAEDLMQSHAYCLAMERAQLPSCQFRYIVGYDPQANVVAHAGIYAVATPLDLFLPQDTVLARFIQRVRKYRAGFLRSTVVECGSPVALSAPLVVAQGLSAKAQDDFAQAVHKAMQALARETGADLLVIRDFQAHRQTDEGSKLWQAFRRQGYKPAPNLENAQLRVRWKGFDAYMTSLRSHYRRQLRLQQGKAAAAGLRHEYTSDFASYAPRLAELWHATASQSTTQLREHLDAAFFRSIAEHLGEKAFVSLFWLEGKLVAFTLYFANGPTLVPLYIGIDYLYKDQAALVFNTYQDWVATAIDRGFELIEMGLTSYEAKMRLGAQLHGMQVLIQHRQAWLTRISVAVYRFLTPQQTVLSRQVFNADQGTDPTTPTARHDHKEKHDQRELASLSLLAKGSK